jgi:hypothetical protein
VAVIVVKLFLDSRLFSANYFIAVTVVTEVAVIVVKLFLDSRLFSANYFIAVTVVTEGGCNSRQVVSY